MSDQQPATPPGPNRFVSGLLLLLGIILLFPGLCSLYFAIDSFTRPGNRSLRGLLLHQDPDIQALWLICLSISAGGVALLITAIRRLRRN